MDFETFKANRGILEKLSREYELLKASGGKECNVMGRLQASNAAQRRPLMLLSGRAHPSVSVCAADVDYAAWVRMRLREAATEATLTSEEDLPLPDARPGPIEAGQPGTSGSNDASGGPQPQPQLGFSRSVACHAQLPFWVVPLLQPARGHRRLRTACACAGEAAPEHARRVATSRRSFDA